MIKIVSLYTNVLIISERSKWDNVSNGVEFEVNQR